MRLIYTVEHMCVVQLVYTLMLVDGGAGVCIEIYVLLINIYQTNSTN